MSLLMKESEERSSNIDEQKARIRQRYKGIDPEELEVIPALPPEDIFKTEKKLRVYMQGYLRMIHAKHPHMNYRKIIIRM